MFDLSTLLNFEEPKEVSYFNGKRYYLQKDSDSIWLPSVTSVLGEMVEKKGLEEWKQRVGEVEAKKRSNQGKSRGTAIHKICEDYILGRDYRSNALGPMIASFNTIKPHLDENITEIYGVEAPLYSKYLKVAGRTDLVGKWTGKKSIIDFKSSGHPKKVEDILDYFYQTAIYSVMFEETTGIPINQLVIIIAVDCSEPQIFIEKRDRYIYTAIELVRKYHELHGSVTNLRLSA